MDDMDVLLHLYDWMKQEKLVFKSPIGEAFFADIVERVAPVPAAVRCREKDRGQKETTDRLRKNGGIICVIAAVICFAIYFGIEYSNYKGKRNTTFAGFKADFRECTDNHT